MTVATTWHRFREAIGRVWGATTTTLLGLGTQIDPLLQNIDPALAQQLPWLKWAIFGMALGMVVLRFLAPPPPSVPIHIDDAVEVDHASGTVTVVKATAVPAGITDKAAGEIMPPKGS